MLQKTQYKRYEDKILKKFANEDEPQVVKPWLLPDSTVLRMKIYIYMASRRISSISRLEKCLAHSDLLYAN